MLVTLDDNYSSDDEHDARWQRSTWFGRFPSAVQDANGTLTSFDTTGPTDFNAFVADNYIVTNTPGINVKWDVNDHWSAVLDADQSDSQYNPNNGYTDIDADVGYGGAHQQLHRWPASSPQQQRAAVLERLRPGFRRLRPSAPSRRELNG